MWSFRASDIYQGGETEPIQSDGAVPAAFQQLDIESRKNYTHVVARNVRAHSNPQHFSMTVLIFHLISHLDLLVSGARSHGTAG